MYKFREHMCKFSYVCKFWEQQCTIRETDPSFVIQHKFMFALQKNVNSPIRFLQLARVWFKFIENPLANAIFFQDSFIAENERRLFHGLQSILSFIV